MYGANALWHIDTHHSLVRWRLVIAGGIDGYSRLITYLHCFDNNQASTVLQCLALRAGSRLGFMHEMRDASGEATRRAAKPRERGTRWAGLGEERACSYYCKFFIPTPEAIKFHRK